MARQIPMVDYLVLDDPPHLVAQRCDACGALYFDRRNACARCSGRAFGRQALQRRGRVRSFTIVHRAAPGVPAPFASGLVELDAGGMVKANILPLEGDPTPDNVRLGMEVELTTFVVGTDDDGTEAIAFGFVPVSGESNNGKGTAR